MKGVTEALPLVEILSFEGLYCLQNVKTSSPITKKE
jgi:hypothetical protein